MKTVYLYCDDQDLTFIVMVCSLELAVALRVTLSVSFLSSSRKATNKHKQEPETWTLRQNPSCSCVFKSQYVNMLTGACQEKYHPFHT